MSVCETINASDQKYSVNAFKFLELSHKLEFHLWNIQLMFEQSLRCVKLGSRQSLGFADIQREVALSQRQI